MINGSPFGFFKNSRGLRQGDPLSPALFILAEEVLSRGLKYIFSSGLVEYNRGGRNFLPVSHLLFADDTLIFLNGKKSSVQRLFLFLERYEKASGQAINRGKSSFFGPKNLSPNRNNMITTISGIPRKQFPC